MSEQYNSAWTGAQIDEAIQKVRENGVIKTEEQTLTDEQKAQARANIGAAAEGEGGGSSGSAEGAVLYTEQTLTAEQQAQARENINANPLTHWRDDQGVAVLESATYAADDNGQIDFSFVLPLVVGEIYAVEFNGVSYDVTASSTAVEGTSWIIAGNMGLLGIGDDTGEPFGIAAAPIYGASVIACAGGAGDYTIGISQPTYHKLNGAYLDYAEEEDIRDMMLDMGLIDEVYGVEWDYTDGALYRTYAAMGLYDPAPAEDLESVGNSPFDEIMPWAGMKRYNVVDGAISYSEDDEGFSETDYETVVYIPEFWYRAEKDEARSRWRWTISVEERSGYTKHPGSGRYVGRYHTTGTVADGLTSLSGNTPLVSVTRDGFRQASHAKGDNWWMLDLATWSAIQMLFLVEYASFDSQSLLGEGQTSGSITACGGTDGAAYHSVKRTGASNQYRWIEDPWANVLDWVDGITWSEGAAYASTDNSVYADTIDTLTDTGVAVDVTTGGYFAAFPTGFSYSEAMPWAFLPGAVETNGPSASDVAGVVPGVHVVYVGGDYGSFPSYGLFYFDAYLGASDALSNVGSRLLYIP